MALSTGITVNNLNNIGNELHEIVHEDIPLTEKVTEITELQLEQSILFERLLRYGEKKLDSKAAFKAYAREKERFDWLSKKADVRIKEAEKIAEEGIRLALSKEIRHKFEEV